MFILRALARSCCVAALVFSGMAHSEESMEEILAAAKAEAAASRDRIPRYWDDERIVRALEKPDTVDAATLTKAIDEASKRRLGQVLLILIDRADTTITLNRAEANIMFFLEDCEVKAMFKYEGAYHPYARGLAQWGNEASEEILRTLVKQPRSEEWNRWAARVLRCHAGDYAIDVAYSKLSHAKASPGNLVYFWSELLREDNLDLDAIKRLKKAQLFSYRVAPRENVAALMDVLRKLAEQEIPPEHRAAAQSVREAIEARLARATTQTALDELRAQVNTLRLEVEQHANKKTESKP